MGLGKSFLHYAGGIYYTRGVISTYLKSSRALGSEVVKGPAFHDLLTGARAPGQALTFLSPCSLLSPPPAGLSWYCLPQVPFQTELRGRSMMAGDRPSQGRGRPCDGLS